MKQEEANATAEEIIKKVLKTRSTFLLDSAVAAGVKTAHTLMLARTIDANMAAHLIADVWLQGWMAAKAEEDRNAR